MKLYAESCLKTIQARNPGGPRKLGQYTNVTEHLKWEVTREKKKKHTVMCAWLRTNTARTLAHANTRMHEHLRKALRRVCTSSDAVTGTLSLAEPGHKNKRACMHTQIRLLNTNRGRQMLPPVTQVSECWPSFSFFFCAL